MKKRLEFIDLTKLLAILLIITSHTNFLPDNLNIFFNSFYITVFFVCTGYTFNEEKINNFKNLSNQVLKLIKYYIFYSFILLIIYTGYSYLKGTLTFNEIFNNIIGILYCRYTYYIGCKDILMGIGNAPMWFIGCYILSYSLFFVLMKYLKKYSVINLVVLLIAGYFLSIFKFLLPWSLDIVPYTVVFIYLGIYIKKYDIFSLINIPIILLLTLILITMTLFSSGINLSLKNYGINYFYTFYMGVVGSVLLISISKYLCNFAIFKKISAYGKYTIDMMCYHLLIIFLLNMFLVNYKILSVTIILIVVISFSKFINKIVSNILNRIYI